MYLYDVQVQPVCYNVSVGGLWYVYVFTKSDGMDRPLFPAESKAAATAARILNGKKSRVGVRVRVDR